MTTALTWVHLYAYSERPVVYYIIINLLPSVIEWVVLYLLQPLVEFQNLTLARQYKVDRHSVLFGFCFDDSKLFCVERRLEVPRNAWLQRPKSKSVEPQPPVQRHLLTMYSINGDGDLSLSLMSSVELRDVEMICHPRVDNAHQVYVPCWTAGIVTIFRYEGGRLQPARDPLTCVEAPTCLSFDAAGTLYVCDNASKFVCLVNVSTNTVIRRLDKPALVGDYKPRRLSVLGRVVLVCYGANTLVIHNVDSPTPGQVLHTPEGLREVSSITTGGHSNFVVTGKWPGSHYVYVLDRAGHLLYKVRPHGERVSGYVDCAVVQSQLWLGYTNGYIAVMTPQ